MATKKDDLWENDPYLVEKSTGFKYNVAVAKFEFYKAKGVEPGDTLLANATPEFRKAYANWLKAQQGGSDASKA